MPLRTLQNERVLTRLLEQEMRDSFIDYSMSVIVQRALPDARDGLKPVHRRILYSMLEEGLHPSRPHKKSATVVGTVLGRYHPHGDSAVYDSIVRMVQDFSLRYPLVDGQGNFGSIDGDSAAAYRYTEVRMTPVAIELLDDIDRDTVDMRPNFDGRLAEPEVLPCRLPHLLLNGSDGIAVGMATKIPPHNATELLSAVDHLAENPECDLDDLLALLPGPDFPTGGYIWGKRGIESAYRTGRGRLEMRARIHLEEGRFGKTSLVVTELPYQVNKTRVIEQITRLARAGRLAAVTDLRDESDRDGIRLMIELKRDAKPESVVNTLFKRTQLRYTFGVIMLALVGGKPEEMDLKTALGTWISHRLDVIRRGAAHDLAKARDRAHIVEGLLAALEQIDRVIEIIRGSRAPESARKQLRQEFDLSKRQADAILAMRLAQLTGLERDKLASELEELEAGILRFAALVEDEATRRGFLRNEIRELAAAYGDPRRTEILDGSGTFKLARNGGRGARLVLASRAGYVKAQPAATGTGLGGAEALATRKGDFTNRAFLCGNSDTLMVITARGMAYALSIDALPHSTRSSTGKHLGDFINLAIGDEVVSLIKVDAFKPERCLVAATRHGQVKRSPLSEYANARAAGIIGTGIGRGDEVVAAFATDGTSDLVFATRSGQTIRFRESEVRVTGRTSRGVKAIDLARGDVVVAAAAPRADADLMAATSAGYGKRIPFTEFKVQGRAGKGLSLLPDGKQAGELAGLIEASGGDDIAWELSDGTLEATRASAIPRRGLREASLRVIGLPTNVAVEAVHTLYSGHGRNPASAGPGAGLAPVATPRPRDLQAGIGQTEFDLGTTGEGRR